MRLRVVGRPALQAEVRAIAERDQVPLATLLRRMLTDWRPTGRALEQKP